MSLTGADFMDMAVALGRRGLGRTWPNPSVGCVIVKDGRVVGRGRTADGGRPHAEPQALAQAGEAARGATAYVTLEPCAHVGQTGPCANALVKAGVARVLIALEDPDPRVSGKGIAILKAAGIEVEIGLCAESASAAQAGFLLRMTENRPFVTLKLASSFDGRIATASGESQWITGADARRRVHALRSSQDAVMVGGGTARKDDPTLTVRGLGMHHQPVRIVASRRLDLPLMGQLARGAQEVPVWLCHGRDADDTLAQTWEGLGAKLLPCDVVAGQLGVRSMLEELAANGLCRVFCEGGGQLAASLLAAGCVDRLVGFTAGKVIGAEGLPSVGALGLTALAAAPGFSHERTERVGEDVMHVWTRCD